jgi:hypothetical protein
MDCDPYVPTSLRLINNMADKQTPISSHWFFLKSLDVLRCRFVHRHCRAILRTYSESFIPGGSIDTNFSSLRLSWAENSFFIDVKNIPSGFCRFLAQKCSSRIISTSLNDYCSAQNRPRELKLVSLEVHGNEDSENVFKFFLASL